MAFDSKQFLKQKYVYREEEVSVPDLGLYFKEGDKPLWKVRGLTGQELGRVHEAVGVQKNIRSALSALEGVAESDKVEGFKKALGVSGDVTEDVAQRIEMLVQGSVSPKCSQELAVRLCEKHPIEFFLLSNTVVKLTGKGHMPGKSKPSGKEPTSEIV